MKTYLNSYRVPSIVGVTLIAFGIAIWVGISHLQELAHIELERKESEWRQKWFDDVKGGKHYATIMDPKIIPMLANDSDCVRNITALHFSMVKIEPNEASPIEQLVNVRHIFFYDTRGTDAVLESAKKLQVESLAFDMARPSEASLKGLADFPSLKKIHFGHILYPREIAILETLDPKIELDAIHRAEVDPPR